MCQLIYFTSSVLGVVPKLISEYGELVLPEYDGVPATGVMELETCSSVVAGAYGQLQKAFGTSSSGILGHLDAFCTLSCCASSLFSSSSISIWSDPFYASITSLIRPLTVSCITSSWHFCFYLLEMIGLTSTLSPFFTTTRSLLLTLSSLFSDIKLSTPHCHLLCHQSAVLHCYLHHNLKHCCHLDQFYYSNYL